MVAEQSLGSLGNFFLFPEGLAALSALIPLLIFYLVKKKPERQVMPSYMFFREDKSSGSASQAFQTLLRNLILLLHILIVIGFASAIAEPYLESSGSPEHSVLVLDRSASMGGDFSSAKEFLKENTGEENTVIFASGQSTVRAQRVTGRQASGIIDDAEIKDTSTDIVSALEDAQGRGSVFIASDLDQTVDSESPENVIERYRSSGINFEIMRTDRRNSWGIVDLDAGRQITEVDIKNFENQENSIQMTANGKSRQIDIPGKSVETVEVESQIGRNRLRIEKDRFERDNTGFFYIPEDDSYSVLLISDERNRHLETVFELVNFTSVETVKPPLDNLPEADLYVVGKTDRIITETIDKIERRIEEGDSLVLYGNQEFENMGFDNLPVEDSGDNRNLSLLVEEPVRINLGETLARDVTRTRGETLTDRSNILVRSGYGSGEMLFYNIQDSEFRQHFLYPVFWKEITAGMLDRKELEDLNLETGDEINFTNIQTPEGERLSGNTELERKGFYNTSSGIVAVNMLDEDESLRDEISVRRKSNDGTETQKQSVQNLASLFLLLLVLGELAYLYRIGDLN